MLKSCGPIPVRLLACAAVFSTVLAAEIPGLCNTGETHKTFAGCSGTLVTPNPPGGGGATDPNWGFAYRTSAIEPGTTDACTDKLIAAYVDTPNPSWMPDTASTASEWITPFDGENNVAAGYYIYVTIFNVGDSPAPTGFTINGQLASDNETVGIYLATPAGNRNCELVSGQPFPVNPAGRNPKDYTEWWPFSFSNTQPLAVASPAALYFVVKDSQISPTGLRVEFFPSSSFH